VVVVAFDVVVVAAGLVVAVAGLVVAVGNVVAVLDFVVVAVAGLEVAVANVVAVLDLVVVVVAVVFLAVVTVLTLVLEPHAPRMAVAVRANAVIRSLLFTISPCLLRASRPRPHVAPAVLKCRRALRRRCSGLVLTTRSIRSSVDGSSAVLNSVQRKLKPRGGARWERES